MSENAARVTVEALLENAGWIRRLARQLVGDEHLVEDVVQDTWLVALTKQVSAEGNLRAWLRSVLRNVSRAALRRKRRAVPGEVARESDEPPVDVMVERAELQREIVTVVLGLDAPYRAVVLLRYFEGLEPSEIARRQGVPASTVRVRLKRALDLVRASLDARHGGRSEWQSVILFIPAGAKAIVAPSAAGLSKAVMAASALFVFVLGAAALIVSRSASFGPEPTERGAELRVSGKVEDRPPATMTVAAVEAATGLPTEAPRTLGTLSGRVRADGAGAQGALVMVVPCDLKETAGETASPFDPPCVRRATAGLDGSFVCDDLPEGDPLIVYASAPGRSPVVVHPVFGGVTIELHLPRGSTLEGRVRDQTGRAISGATVSWKGVTVGCEVVRSARSGDDGAYRIEGLPAEGLLRGGAAPCDPVVTVEADGFAPAVETFDISAGAPGFRPRDVELRASEPVIGRVVDDETGAALPGAEVLLWFEGSYGLQRGASGQAQRNPFSAFVQREQTDREGSFRFAHRPVIGLSGTPGSPSLQLAARAIDHGPAVTVVRTPGSGEAVSPTEVRLPRGARLHGRVVDALGMPLEGVPVLVPEMRALGFAWPREIAADRGLRWTDRSGAYRFDGLRPASPSIPAVNVRAIPPGMIMKRLPSVCVDLVGGQDLLVPDLVVPAADRVDFVVVDDLGSPVRGATLTLVPPGSGTLGAVQARTDAKGSAALRLRPGSSDGEVKPFRVFVARDGRELAVSPVVEPRAAGKEPVTVTLKPGHVIEGIVVARDGTPLPDIGVLVTDESDEGRRASAGDSLTWTVETPWMKGLTRTGSDGRFRLTALPRGPLLAHLRRKGPEGRVDRIIEGLHPDGGAIEIAFDRPGAGDRPAAVLEVAVVERGRGTAVENLRFRLRGEHEVRNGSGLESGFRVAGLSAGRWTLDVTPPGYVPARDLSVVIGEKTEVVHRLDVTLERGITISGRVVGLPRFEANRWKLFFDGGDSDPEPGVPIASDGGFTVPGLEPGRPYSITMTDSSPTAVERFVRRAGERFTPVRSDDRGFVELDVVPASVLHISVTGVLPGHRSPRVEVRAPDGAVLWSRRLATDIAETLLPPGEYEVRLLTGEGETPLMSRKAVLRTAEAFVTLHAGETGTDR